MSDCDEGDVETCEEHQARYPTGRCDEKDCPCCDRVKRAPKKATYKTVCAGCGEKDGEHVADCKDLDGIRIRLEKRIKELEAALEVALISHWDGAIEAAAIEAEVVVRAGTMTQVPNRIRQLKKGK